MPTSTPPARAGPAPSGGEALGRSQGGFSTKVHLRAEGHGRPITAVLTGGERHEQIALEAVLDQGAIRRKGRGRPRLRPRRVAGDKAYSSPTARGRVRRRGITPVIPSKSNERPNPRFDREAYRLRNRVERMISRLKQARRIATRGACPRARPEGKARGQLSSHAHDRHDPTLDLAFADTP